MIISASRRTDIPAFYSEWFERRVQEGFLYVRNPMNAHQVSEVSLAPEVVDCIVFWTKNPIPLMGRLGSFEAFPYYFQLTLTGYGRDVEPNVPDKKGVLIPAFKQLSERIGPERVIWRYDPIAFTPKYTAEYHLHAIGEIARMLDGCTEKCVISFVDGYTYNHKALAEMGSEDVRDDQLLEFCKQLAETVRAHGMSVATCAERVDLDAAGIEHNACVDARLIERISGRTIRVSKDKSQRLECGCFASIDVGSYNTCGAGCRYCYARRSDKATERNLLAYDPTSPMLCDALGPDDVVHKREMRSLFVRQDRGQSSDGRRWLCRYWLLCLLFAKAGKRGPRERYYQQSSFASCYAWRPACFHAGRRLRVSWPITRLLFGRALRVDEAYLMLVMSGYS